MICKDDGVLLNVSTQGEGLPQSDAGNEQVGLIRP